MAERFTVYSFQLRPDDYVRFVGGFESDEEETYSEEEFSGIFGGYLEKQHDMANDMDALDESIFDIEPEEEDIFNIEEVL